MKYLDFHCDTLELFTASREPSGDLYRNEKAVDFCRMRKAGMKGQFFAMWLPAPDMTDEFHHPDAVRNGLIWDEGYLRTEYEGFCRSVREHEDMVQHAVSWKDYEQIQQNGKMAVFLTLEDGRPVNGRMENIRALHEGGVALITLTWNGKNCFGSPNSRDEAVMNEGLTPFGKAAVEYMNELGMLVDVSHLSDAGFNDVAEISRKPFVASHSNARALSPHPRNMTDDMIRRLADAGGVMGLNYCPEFLTAGARGKDSRIEDMVRHLAYIRKVGGSGILALGSDLDGISGNLEIDSVDKTPNLFDALKKHGFTSSELEGLACKNLERVLKEALN